MTRIVAAKLIQALAVAMLCIPAARAGSPAANEPASVWPSRTGVLHELAEIPPAEPDNEIDAAELQRPWWQRAAPLADRILICRPAR
jgi:hypothetical protein